MGNKENHWYSSEEELESLEYLEMPTPHKGRLHGMILQDPISQLNIPNPIVLQSDDPVAKAVQMMRKLRYGSVLVCVGETLVGIFTEKDLLSKTLERNEDLAKIPLADVMTPDPERLEEEHTLAHALNLMAVKGCRHIPIANEGRPHGFVSIRGILSYISANALQT